MGLTVVWPPELKTRVRRRKLRLYQHQDGLSYGREKRRSHADLVLMLGGQSWGIAWRHNMHVPSFKDPESAAAALDAALSERHRSE